MALMKRSVCLLLLTLAADLAPSVVGSSHVTSTASFSPRPRAISLKREEISHLPRDEAVLEKAVSSRGGAADSGKAVAGALTFAAIDAILKEVFKANDIKLPAQLAGCVGLFAVMVLAEAVSPGAGDAMFAALTPGANLLAKWLPVFFIPGLAMLPLAPSVGSGLEVAKTLAVVVLGFLFSISSTAFAVLGLRTATGAIAAPEEAEKPKKGRSAAKRKEGKATEAPKPKPYSEDTLDFLIKGTILSGAVSIAATRTDFEWATPLQMVYLGFASFATFVWGARLPAQFTQVVHPLITSTILTLLVMRLTGMATDAEFLDVLRSYKVGSLDPLKAGAGDLILNLLGPAVVSFSMSMYSRKTLLKDNLLVILTAAIVSSVGGLFGTAAFVRLIQLGGAADTFLRRSVLSRNVTTALAIAITKILEGDIAIGASAVVLTGIIGATYGRSVLTAMGIKDPVSRGLGIGAAAQSLGVASIVSEKDAFPFAAISMLLTAVSATCLVSVPAVKDALINIAMGAATSAATDAATGV